MFLVFSWTSIFSIFIAQLERCETQPVAAQVLHAGGERQGRRLDCRRD